MINPQMEKLNGLLSLLETDKITVSQFEGIFSMFLKVLKDMKAQVDEAIFNNSVEISNRLKSFTAEIQSSESLMEKMMNEAVSNSKNALALKEALASEINRIETLIPSLPDLTYLEDKINEIESKIPIVRPPILDTPEEVRNKLETLKEDERLDISAIKGFEQKDKKLSDWIIERAMSIFDHRTSFLINKVSNLSDRLDRFSATGGGHTIQDEGISLTTRTNLNFVGAAVTVTDDAGNNATKVTISPGATANITAENITGVQSGSNVTLDLTTLAHVFGTIFGVFRQGQLKTLNDLTYGYSISGNTVTVYNADASESFVVQYTY